MLRSKAHQILARILAKLDAEEMPIRITECYVFGSYAAGAAEPGDLDLILVHDQVPFRHPYWSMPNPPVVLGKALRKPGEKIDIITGTSLTAALDVFGKVTDSPRILLWSEQERNWQERLAEIPVIAGVTRHERNHFADLRRFNATAIEMECLTEAIKIGFVKLERVNLAEVAVELNPVPRKWFDWWSSNGLTGRETVKTLEYAMWWMQEQKDQSSERPRRLGRCELVSEDGKYRAYMGTPPLRATAVFSEPDARVLKICLVPHIKRGLPKELFVFEPGEKWERTKFAEFEEEFQLKHLR